jgi:hypothetical protein
MRYRSLLVVPLCLTCVALGSMLNRPATGQAPAVQRPSAEGRFRMYISGQNPPTIAVTDSVTGRTWARDLNFNRWTELGIPPGADK